MFRERFFAATAIAVALSAGTSTASAALSIVDSFDTPGGVSQLVYSAETNQLVIRNSGSAIKLVDLSTHSVVSTHQSNSIFTDIDLAGSGRYLYAADYGYEHIGYGTPLSQNYVHRLDLQTKTWSVQTTSRNAGRIEALDDGRFALQSLDQWVDISVNAWGSAGAVEPVGNELSWSVYSGDIQYDATHGRLLHGNSGISSPEVAAFRLNGNNLTRQEYSGTYGAAYNGGGSVVLASDDSALYYGSLQFDSLDMTFVQRSFPELILAANGDYAFSATGYYDAKTGQRLGGWDGNYTVFGLGSGGKDLWAFDATSKKLVHIAEVPEASTLVMMSFGLALAGFVVRRRAV